jgi:hypothetical protein
MIVRPAVGVVHLITQPDHAALSGRIMEHWAPLAGEPRRASILLAVAEHDNGWREPDHHPALAADGRVVDFVNAPAALKQGVWPRGVDALAADPLAAALVAQHAITVYDRFRGDAEWSSFFAQMEAIRDEHRARAGVSEDVLATDYAFVRIGDLISLTFCVAWREAQRFDGVTVRLQGDSQVVVTPRALDVTELRIEVAARELRVERFESDETFLQALDSAPTVTLHGVVTTE